MNVKKESPKHEYEKDRGQQQFYCQVVWVMGNLNVLIRIELLSWNLITKKVCEIYKTNGRGINTL